MKKSAVLYASVLAVAISGCNEDSGEFRPVTLSQSSATSASLEKIAIVAATPSQCPNGGSVFVVYADANGNSFRDEGEIANGATVVCSGTNGANGADGTNGTNGTNGSNGTDGKNGVDGTNGKDGVNGQDGVNGANGKDGTNGTNGKDGVDGTNGKDGTNGTNGKDGTNGTNGTNGSNGHAVVFKIQDGASGCVNGGKTLFFALDLNNNGVLDDKDGSLASTEICNGENGKDGTTTTTGDCSVKLKTSEWLGGYNVDVYVKNKGEALLGWKVGFTLPSGHKLAEIWEATANATSGKIEASSLLYNAGLYKNDTLHFGIKVSRSDTALLTSDGFTLNGVKCSKE